MRAHRPFALVALALLGSIVLACGGGGGGGSTEATAPTVTNVIPAEGPTTGGTPLTLTGTAFAAGATVTVGGSAATDVVVVDPTTITCVTPAGAAGNAQVAVTVDGLTGTWSGTFLYVLLIPPTISDVTPPDGSTFGGMQITITGTGFTENGAGSNTVTVGGTSAVNVTTVDDTTIECDVPEAATGTNATVPVTVTNANGTTDPAGTFRYFEPLFLADAGGDPPPPTFNLYEMDPATGNVRIVGEIGHGVTGMDFNPLTGVLYGTTAPGSTGGTRQLVTIDPLTGAGTVVGPLDDATATTNFNVPDIAYVQPGSVLYGTERAGPMATGGNLVTVSPTGTVAIVGANGAAGQGGAFAASGSNPSIVYYMTSDTGSLYQVAVGSSTFTAVSTLNGFSHVQGVLAAATFHDGTLYAVDVDIGGPGIPVQAQVVTIDPGTGLVQDFFAPLISAYINAIASRTR